VGGAGEGDKQMKTLIKKPEKISDRKREGAGTG